MANAKKCADQNLGYKVFSFALRGVYTVVATSKEAGASLWGKLKSGIGWLSFDFKG